MRAPSGADDGHDLCLDSLFRCLLRSQGRALVVEFKYLDGVSEQASFGIELFDSQLYCRELRAGSGDNNR
ncbi:MAG: hypothetical protein MZV70_14205 [Desulfobacterales bacterium]|nr:hypothetical protein [Desulfobacterales bacterium]